MENIRESSVGCSHVCKQPHLSSIYKLHKEQRLGEGLGINPGGCTLPACISNFSSFDMLSILLDISVFNPWKGIVGGFWVIVCFGFPGIANEQPKLSRI